MEVNFEGGVKRLGLLFLWYFYLVFIYIFIVIEIVVMFLVMLCRGYCSREIMGYFF